MTFVAAPRRRPLSAILASAIGALVLVTLVTTAALAAVAWAASTSATSTATPAPALWPVALAIVAALSSTTCVTVLVWSRLHKTIVVPLRTLGLALENIAAGRPDLPIPRVVVIDELATLAGAVTAARRLAHELDRLQHRDAKQQALLDAVARDLDTAAAHASPEGARPGRRLPTTTAA
ncbi:MAG: hypothetical protein AAFX81_15795 [Pseudomonadota bacterium]